MPIISPSIFILLRILKRDSVLELSVFFFAYLEDHTKFYLYPVNMVKYFEFQMLANIEFSVYTQIGHDLLLLLYLPAFTGFLHQCS